MGFPFLGRVDWPIKTDDCRMDSGTRGKERPVFLLPVWRAVHFPLSAGEEEQIMTHTLRYFPYENSSP